MKDHGNYWIVRAKGSKETATARSFREWLMSEMADTNKKFAGTEGCGKTRKTVNSTLQTVLPARRII